MQRAARLQRSSRIFSSLILVLMLTIAGTNANAQVNISEKHITFDKVLKEIRKQTGYNFVCKDEWVKNIGPIDIEARNATIEQVIESCLSGKPFLYTISNKMITIYPQPILIDVTGKVTDEAMNPMPGVSVTIKGSASGVPTDQNGEFQLYGIDPKSLLVFSYVGYESLQEKVNNRARIVVKLSPENKMMENATVSNGYQRIQLKYLTGSVTSLKMDSIMQPGMTTVDKMLEGRVPGLTYMVNSGQAGAVPKLRIRGTSTILGTREPLWVVDGIARTDPFPVPADRLNDLDFVNLLGNSISGINPHDIEQIDVLKDAAATALYGVRAGNGVIVITTKRGKPGPPTFNYNVTGTFTVRPRYTDRNVYQMNSAERVDVSREMIEKRLTFRGSAIEGYEKAIMNYYNGFTDFATYKSEIDKAEKMNTDWFNILTRNAFSTNHSLSISGGNSTSSYRASLGYTDEPGVIRAESNKRYTGSLNVRLTEKKFKADFTVLLNKAENKNVPQDLGIMNYAYGTSRSIPLYNEDGSLYYYSPVKSTYLSYDYEPRSFNVINEINSSGNTFENSGYTATANINYNILEGLQFNSTFSYTGGIAEQLTWYGANTDWVKSIRSAAWDITTQSYAAASDGLPFGGELQQQTSRTSNYTVNGRLDFKKFLDKGKRHLLSGALGSEITSNKSTGVQQIRRGYYPERGQSFAIIDPAVYTTYGQWLKQAGNPTLSLNVQNFVRSFLTVYYSYKDEFVLNGTTSSDFSNAFGTRSNERFLPTWALSGKWNLNNSLLKSINWIDLAALRLSYGIKGNMLQNQTPYTIINKGSLNSYFGAFGSTITAFPNPGLAWEKLHDYGAAIDFSFLNGKLSGSIGVYYKKTSNAFLSKKVSAINGATTYIVNGGAVENKGIEIDLHFKPVNNTGINGKKGFMWRIDPQLGQVFNRLLNQNLRTNNILVDPNSINFSSFLNGSVPVDGKAVNTFYSYRFKGLDPEYGFPVFYGAEPDNAEALVKLYNTLSKEQVYGAVMVESGKREPVLQGGISNYFAYRNWMLSFTFSYSLGNKIRLMQIASGNYGTFRPSSQQNLRKEFVDRWRYPGDELKTNIPALVGSDNLPLQRFAWWEELNPQTFFASDYYQMYDNSDLRVVSGDYLKLQYLSLGYNVSQSVCERYRIKGATISFTGNNLFTITNKRLRGQDPSQSGSATDISLSLRPVFALNFNLSF